MRISVQAGSTFLPVDEHFNKHILFHSNGFTGDIMYTGVARWGPHGRRTNLYDVISESVARSAEASLALSPLVLKLVDDISSALKKQSFLAETTTTALELHIVGYQKQIPWPMICVISTFRKQPPWPASPEDMQWEYQYPGVSVFLKAPEQPIVVLGGADTFATPAERKRLLVAVASGADAFNVARLSAKLIEAVAERTTAVGRTSVSVVLPTRGIVDTNLWDRSATGLRAFLPRVVFENGTMIGPSEFPVTLHLLTAGHLPKQSLFFKSIVSHQFKRGLKRRLFRKKGGPPIPGLMGLLSLLLFGQVPERYTDFGLADHSDDPENIPSTE